MNTVRLNITLPEELAHQLDEIVGPGKKSKFIADILKERIQRIQREELEKTLEEGYKVRRNESLASAKEFEVVDLEGWDEY